MPPVVADAILIDIEGGVVIPPVTVAAPKGPHQKPSIPRDPKTSTRESLSSAPTLARTNYLRNRIIMFFLIYVVLTYPFSYSVCRKIWPLATNVGGDSKLSTQPVSKARSKINAVKSEYEQCTRDQGLQCRLQTNMDAAEENVRLVVVHSINMNKVNESQQGQNQCRMSDFSARMTLHETVVNNMDLPFLDNEETCPADAKTIIRTMAGADTQAELLGVEEIVIQQFDRNQEQFDELVDYAHDRAVYDYNYFVGVSVDILDSLIIKLDGLNFSLDAIFNGLNVDLLGGFEVFLACIHDQESSTVICPVPSVSIRIANFLRPLQGQLQFLAMLLKTALSTIQDLIDQYNSLRAVLRSLNIVFGELRKVFGAPFDLIWNSFNAPNLSLYGNLPDGNIFNSLDLNLSIPGIGSLPSTSAIWDFVAKRADDFKDLLKAALNRALTLLRTSIGGLKNFIELQRIRILKDYDPPNYPGTNSTDIRGLKRTFGAQKEKFLDAFRAMLNALTATAALVSENNTFVPPTSTLDLSNVTSDVQKASLELLDIIWPTIPPFLHEVFDWIIWIFGEHIYFLFEMGCLLWHTFNRYRYYWNQSSIPITEVNVGVSSEQARRKEPKRSRLSRLLDLLFHDRTKTIFWMLSLLLVFSVLAVIYEAYYNHYYNKCVVARNGTIFTNGFILPLETNRVLIEGDKILQGELLAFYEHSSSLCATVKRNSSVMHLQQEARLLTIANDRESTIAAITPLLACIDFDALRGAEPGLYDELLKCTEPVDTTLENGVAVCDWRTCEIECGRIEAQQEIRLVVVEEACKYEYKVQSDFFLFLCIQLQYWSLFFTRRLVLDGCLRLFWNKLRPPTVKVKYDHDVVEGRAVNIDMDNDDLDKATKGAIARHLRHERNQGYLRFVLAFLMNVPWIAIMIYLNKTGVDPLRPMWL